MNVISKKGGTVYAPASNTANMIQMLLQNSNCKAVCSAILDGEYGLRDLSIGVPVELSRSGIKRIVEWRLSDDEMKTFLIGAERLKRVIDSLIEKG